jgi:hypothetical protein
MQQTSDERPECTNAGIVFATRANGRWMALRDILPGRNIPGHAGCW